jgi:flagellum-specific ATP synthase
VLDQAIALYPRMEGFLQQQLSEQSDFTHSVDSLTALF